MDTVEIAFYLSHFLYFSNKNVLYKRQNYYHSLFEHKTQIILDSQFEKVYS